MDLRIPAGSAYFNLCNSWSVDETCLVNKANLCLLWKQLLSFQTLLPSVSIKWSVLARSMEQHVPIFYEYPSLIQLRFMNNLNLALSFEVPRFGCSMPQTRSPQLGASTEIAHNIPVTMYASIWGYFSSASVKLRNLVCRSADAYQRACRQCRSQSVKAQS